MTHSTDEQQRLLDKDSIRDVMYRYARATDRRDLDLVRSCFFEDSIDNHGSFVGPREEYLKWWWETSACATRISHALGNCFIEFATDTRALVETYYIACSELAIDGARAREMFLAKDAVASGQSMTINVFGRYIDRFEKRNGEWKIAGRQVTFDVTESRPTPSGREFEGLLGRRDHQDPIYSARALIGLTSY